MEHDEEVVAVPAAGRKVNHVHDAVGLLEQVEGPLVLLSLDELVGRVVELGEHNGDFVLANAQLLVVVAVEGVVLPIDRLRKIRPNGRALLLVARRKVALPLLARRVARPHTSLARVLLPAPRVRGLGPAGTYTAGGVAAAAGAEAFF